MRDTAFAPADAAYSPTVAVITTLPSRGRLYQYPQANRSSLAMPVCITRTGRTDQTDHEDTVGADTKEWLDVSSLLPITRAGTIVTDSANRVVREFVVIAVKEDNTKMHRLSSTASHCIQKVCAL
jgi:hypothetical protein